MQTCILRKILKLPISTATSALFLDTGIVPVLCLIERRQLSYLWRLDNLSDEILSCSVFNCQQKYRSFENNWFSHINELCSKFNLNDYNIKMISQMNWKMTVKRLLNSYYFNNLFKNQSKKTKELFCHKTSF